ncbi:PREDICTED: uncharacterized protein LOC107170449 [Diuraphis noxia]|uniref:uncharacterized protein LOC107170449 n=1 Tax=Diuraphis noxia TaxID=143948 RepID=UPI000763B4B9|nr:PREDICTED: uncharacterized protein LOC107170449 [Diuraphis noxia]
MTYKSIDSVANQDDVDNYSTEFLNSLELPRSHNLQLKIGSVIIMLRNINQPRLCNGTRLVVKKLMNNVIESHNFERKVQRRRRFDSTDSFDSEQHAIRQVAISSAVSI